MPSLHAEVTGLYDRAGDANHLLYTPLARALTARETRRYLVEYDGDGAALTAFLAKVLADRVSHELTTGDAPKFTGSSFILDYGMKGGALDLEKETILAHHRGDVNPPFTIRSLRINRRIYIFDPAKQADTLQLADRFVRDIVNPAIHTWKVTSGAEADALVADAAPELPVAPVAVAAAETPAVPEPVETTAAESVAEATPSPAEEAAVEAPAPVETEAAPASIAATVEETVGSEVTPVVGTAETESTPAAEATVDAEAAPVAEQPAVADACCCSPGTCGVEESPQAPEAENSATGSPV